jgi:zinc/manganese transport system permease protein
MLATEWKSRLIIGWIVAVVASLVGLTASYKLDLPTGAAIVCACGVLLAIASIVAAVRPRGGAGRRAREVDRRGTVSAVEG